MPYKLEHPELIYSWNVIICYVNSIGFGWRHGIVDSVIQRMNGWSVLEWGQSLCGYIILVHN